MDVRGSETEADLLASLCIDLDTHFERLVTTFQNRIYAFALRLTASAPDAEEIAQDVFLNAYHALETYEHERIATLALRAWLYKIALNITRNRMRGKRLHLVSLDGKDGSDAFDLPSSEVERPDAVVVRSEQRDELGLLLSALPERYRAAVILRHIEGLGYNDLASILNQPVGTVKANVHRGVALLRQALDTQISEVM